MSDITDDAIAKELMEEEMTNKEESEVEECKLCKGKGIIQVVIYRWSPIICPDCKGKTK